MFLNLTTLTLPSLDSSSSSSSKPLSTNLKPEHLSQSDLNRYERYHHLPDKQRFLGGRGLLRWEVARLEREERKIQGEGERIRKAQDQEMSKTDNEELEENDKKQQVEHKLELGFGERGKPFLQHPILPDLIDFNLSHDQSLILLGTLAPKRSQNQHDRVIPNTGKSGSGNGKGLVGVDIMRLDRTGRDAEGLEEVLIDQLNPFEIARIPFSPSSSQTPKAKLNHLLSIWTIKESFVKALGEGLNLEMKRVEVDVKVDSKVIGLREMNEGGGGGGGGGGEGIERGVVGLGGTIGSRSSERKGEEGQVGQIGSSVKRDQNNAESNPLPNHCHLCSSHLSIKLDEKSLTATDGWHASFGIIRIDPLKDGGGVVAVEDYSEEVGGEEGEEEEGSGRERYVWSAVWKYEQGEESGGMTKSALVDPEMGCHGVRWKHLAWSDLR